MAPTNRLIEARRAELRAESNIQKPSVAKAATARADTKRPTGQPKARTKSKT